MYYTRPGLKLGRLDPAGIHKCVAAGTLLSTVDRGLLPIERLAAPGQPAQTWAPADIDVHGERPGRHRVVQVYRGALEPVLRITTARGYAITASRRHPLRVRTAAGDHVWRLAPALQVGDTLVLRVGAASGAAAHPATAAFTRRSGHRAPPVVDSALCYVLGVLAGAGPAAPADPDVRQRLQAIAQREFGGVALQPAFLAWCGHGGGAVPWAVLQNTVAAQAAFLRGLCDAAGDVDAGVHLAVAAPVLAAQAHVMLGNLGVVASLGAGPVASRTAVAGPAVHQFADTVGFGCVRRAGRPAAVRRRRAACCTTRSPAWCRHARGHMTSAWNDAEHAFVGNGFINHNCQGIYPTGRQTERQR
jgi:hypothetical protein